MARHALQGALAAAAVPLIAIWGCGGSGDKKTAAQTEPPPAISAMAASSQAPTPVPAPASAPEAEIQAQMEKLETRVGSEAGYHKFLNESGLTDADVRREIERNVQTETYRKSLVAGKGVSEEQAKKFYDANASKGIFNVPEQ